MSFDVNLSRLEIEILAFLKPKLGTIFTPEELYQEINAIMPCEKDFFLQTLHILIKENFVEGEVTGSWGTHSVKGIDRDGLRWLRIYNP